MIESLCTTIIRKLVIESVYYNNKKVSDRISVYYNNKKVSDRICVLQ